DLNPISIPPFKFVFESHLSGVDKAYSGVIYLKIALIRRQRYLGLGADCRLKLFDFNGTSVNNNLFNQNRRRQLIRRHGFRIHNSDALSSRKPEPSVSRLDSGGLSPSIAFDIEQTVLFIISNRGYGLYFPVCEVVQFLFADAVYAFI